MSALPNPPASLLRPYQAQGVAAVVEALERQRSALLVWATGLGKTVAFARIAEEFVSRGQRVLVIAHREELIQQARKKIQHWTCLRVGIERADEKARRSANEEQRKIIHLHQPVVVASIQTLARPRRLATWSPNEFGLIVIDEAHHALAPSYRRVLEHFTGARIVGVTATPDRGDDLALGQVFESVAHSYGIREGIADGYLAPVSQHAVYVDDLDLSKVRTTAGDLNGGDLDEIMREERHLHAVANPIFEIAAERPTLTFAASVEHARLLADQFNRRSAGCARSLDGGTEDRERAATLADFAAGKFRHLVNCALFLEGFDEPSIQCVAIARPTKSRALYSQMVGRGTRLSPETGKTDLLVLDIVGQAGRHSLVSPLDIFAGDMTPMERDEAEALRKEAPGVTVEDLIEQAKKRAAEKAAFEERMRARRQIVAGTKHRTREVSPFGVLGPMPPPGRPGTPPVSDDQRQRLDRLGVTNVGQLDAAQAEAILREAKRRVKQGLCTMKQARLLSRHGVDATNVSFKQAGALISKLKANNWKHL